MNLDEFLACFPDTLVLIKDEFGNIIYPNDVNKLNYIKNFRVLENGTYFNPSSNMFYKVDESLYNKFGKKLTVIRYLDITKDMNYINGFEIDETTGIYVKKKLFNLYEEYLRSITGLKQDFSVIMCDIDHFKHVNDEYGHLTGDVVLKSIASSLYSNIRHNINLYNGVIRQQDFLGRFGGEEFLMVLKNINENDTKNKMEYLRELIEKQKIIVGQDEINVTCSFGGVYVPYDKLVYLENVKNKTVEIMNVSNRTINMSDEELYEAKETGRNKCLVKEYV